MVSERIIEGRRCRLYGNSRYSQSIPLWIANTGDFAAYGDDAGGVYCPCRIFNDFGGPFVIQKIECRREKLYLESPVFESFGPSASYIYTQVIRREQMINHKDGNWMNCDYRNLEIAPYHYRHAPTDRVVLYKADTFLEVHSDGSVWVDGVEMPVMDWNYFDMFDFMDPHYSVVAPFIIINGEKIWMEEIMEEAGFIQGDYAGLKEPAILHKDGDYMNFASGNLEWVRQRDPRYVEYLQHQKETHLIRNAILNSSPR